MPNTYTITVQNNSGSTQKYSLFNEVPVVSANVSAKVWNNALKTANVAPGSSASFTITSQYYAYVGSSDGVPGKSGVAVQVAGSKPVDVGSEDLQGNESLGTTLFMDVIDEAPQFTKTLEPSGKPGAFCINTVAGTKDNDFNVNTATDKNWVIGLGKVINGKTLPAATIMPQPNISYQIQPINKWYVAFGGYTAGQVMNVEFTGLSKAAVDFTTSKSSNAKVVHSAGGQLTTQTAE